MRSAPPGIVIPLFSRFADHMTKIKSIEHGFALFELILAIAIASLVAMWSASAWMRQVDDALAQATGEWMLTVHHAMNQMLRRQSDFMSGLTGDLAAAGLYADLYAPTIAELIRAGHLPKGFALTPPIPYQVAMRIFQPEGECEKIGCRIEALIYAQPLSHQRVQASDITRIGNILTAMQGVGASVHPLKPTRIKGPGLDIDNQIGEHGISLPVGTIVSKSFYDSSHFAHLVRTQDRRDTVLEGRLEVKSGIASQADIHSQRNLQASGRVSAGEFLHLQGIAVAEQACEADGLVSRSASGDLLTCQSGRWRSAGARFGGVYSWHSFHGCGVVAYGPDMSNPFTGGCFCPAGFNPLQISRWKGETSEVDEFRTYICLR